MSERVRLNHFSGEIYPDIAHFEALGFEFESDEHGHSRWKSHNVTLPEGWTTESDVFTLELIDKNGIRRALIEFGNYPSRQGAMWLLEKNNQ